MKKKKKTKTTVCKTSLVGDTGKLDGIHKINSLLLHYLIICEMQLFRNFASMPYDAHSHNTNNNDIVDDDDDDDDDEKSSTTTNNVLTVRNMRYTLHVS